MTKKYTAKELDSYKVQSQWSTLPYDIRRTGRTGSLFLHWRELGGKDLHNDSYLDPETKTIHVVNEDRQGADDYLKSLYGKGAKLIPIPQDLYNALSQRAVVKEEAYQKQKANNEFVAELTKRKISEATLATMTWLQEGQVDFSGISGDDKYLEQYGIVFMYKIEDGHYLLRDSLSGLFGGSSTSSIGVLTGLALVPHNIYWPSTMRSRLRIQRIQGVEDYEKVPALILQWCFDQLTYVQLRYCTSRAKRKGYTHLHHRAMTTFKRAKEKWGHTSYFPVDLAEDCQEMVDLFGDVPKMKEHNAALRMKYEITRRY